MLRKWTTKDIPDLSDSTAIVTGGNSGLGFETALQLAKKGCAVVIACRDTNKGVEAQKKILAVVPDASISVESLNLASFDSVRAFCERMKCNYKSISLLVNNAGMCDLKKSKTADGFETHFQTNYLGPFLLTALLYPLLLADKNARIVNISSVTESMGNIDLDDLNLKKNSGKMQPYANSKLANLLFTFELNRRIQAEHQQVISVAAHPGYATTNILNSGKPSFFKKAAAIIGNTLLAQSAEKGAIPVLYACTGSDVKGGDYYGPDGFFKELFGDHPKLVQASAKACDELTAKKLWDISEKLTGVKFNLTPSLQVEDIDEEKDEPGLSLRASS